MSRGKINVRLKQSNHNRNHNYNSMGFETNLINQVPFLADYTRATIIDQQISKKILVLTIFVKSQ